ncbi:putative oxidoreductase [Fusarium oxysporum f. sp. cubense]|uniref:Putative oxidoreductase n=1 Tax=Fusarium oxysporum f. sp. cubense TaxID=61366 RepID=A0A559LIB1_FUSOC|nr:putative oxidoreductase [Fusarium oxysporum f. sp. cubense]
MRAGYSFNPDTDIPALSEKVVLVTGGNTGLGHETILQLSKHSPAHVFLAARSQDKGHAAVNDIRQATPNVPPISFLQLDLSSFASIQSAVKKFRESSDRLDILINNAGIMATPEGLTEDGYEIQFGTNHLGVALFTKLLLHTMKQTAATKSSDVRVVFVSSSMEENAPKDSYQLDKVKSTMPHISTWARYSMSKLANLQYCEALARNHPDIKFISVHPGIVQTNLSNTFIGSYNPVAAAVIKLASKLLTVNVETGALNQLWAATSHDAVSGEFYYPVGVKGKGSNLSQNRSIRDQLWDWTEKEIEPYVLGEAIQ